MSNASPAAREARPAPPMMRAATLIAPRRFELQQAPTPQPGRGEVRVKLEGCGVCASNLPPWEGRDWFEYPMEPGKLGHEGWGVIDAVGDDVTELAPGDRVALLSDHAYAEYDIAPAAMAIRLPDSDIASGTAHVDVEALEVFPGEPLGCAVNIFKRCDIHAGQTVAVVGVGFLGALLIQLAHHAGARVIALSRRDYALDLARQMGAEATIALDDHQRVIQQVAELTDGSGGYDVRGFCDRVIECTGKEWPLQLASELCGIRARLIIAGYHQDGMRSVNVQLWNWRGLDVINAHERDPAIYAQGVRDAASLVAAGTLNPEPLYTHRFSLEQLDEALQMTHDRPDGFIKALICMNHRT